MAANWDVSGFRDRPEQEREPEIDWEPRRKRRRFGWPRGRRGRFGLITGIVAVVIVGAFIWSGRDRTDIEAAGETPVIRADETPVKIPPESPGGMEVPHRDKLVYQRVPGGDADKMERLLPPPEQPLTPPAPEPTAQPDQARPSALPETAQRETLSEEAAGRDGASGSLFTQGLDQPSPRPAAPMAAQPANPQPPQQQTAGPRALTPPTSPAEPAKTALAMPPKAASPGAAGGGYMIQLVAVRTADQAQGVWTSLRNRNSDLLGGLSPSFVRAELGAKGSVYRLRAGPIASEAQARAVCVDLVKRKVDCIIVRPNG